MIDDGFEIHLDGIVDLRTFYPSEVKNLVSEYLREFGRQEIFGVRIIRREGTGEMWRLVVPF